MLSGVNSLQAGVTRVLLLAILIAGSGRVVTHAHAGGGVSHRHGWGISVSGLPTAKVSSDPQSLVPRVPHSHILILGFEWDSSPPNNGGTRSGAVLPDADTPCIDSPFEPCVAVGGLPDLLRAPTSSPASVHTSNTVRLSDSALHRRSGVALC